MKFGVAFLAFSALACATPALAATNLVTNGDFSSATSTSRSGNFQVTDNGANAYGQLAGWTSGNGSYNLLFNTSNAATAAGNAYGYWSNNGSTTEYLRTLPTTSGGVGAVGNFLALDGDTNISSRSINQTIGAGLVAGQQYTLNFDWATGSLASGSVPATGSGATISLGNWSSTVGPDNVPTSGWTRVSKTFTYGGTNNILSFVANGTPNGAPPMFLLDNVSLTGAVPEPATWALMLVGFGAIGFSMRRKRVSAVSFG